MKQIYFILIMFVLANVTACDKFPKDEPIVYKDIYGAVEYVIDFKNNKIRYDLTDKTIHNELYGNESEIVKCPNDDNASICVLSNSKVRRFLSINKSNHEKSTKAKFNTRLKTYRNNKCYMIDKTYKNENGNYTSDTTIIFCEKTGVEMFVDTFYFKNGTIQNKDIYLLQNKRGLFADCKIETDATEMKVSQNVKLICPRK